ncbi:MAG: hypothetical protein WKF58_19015 [Ilumatobacteraceae bacterium]
MKLADQSVLSEIWLVNTHAEIATLAEAATTSATKRSLPSRASARTRATRQATSARSAGASTPNNRAASTTSISVSPTIAPTGAIALRWPSSRTVRCVSAIAAKSTVPGRTVTCVERVRAGRRPRIGRKYDNTIRLPVDDIGRLGRCAFEPCAR